MQGSESGQTVGVWDGDVASSVSLSISALTVCVIVGWVQGPARAGEARADARGTSGAACG